VTASKQPEVDKSGIFTFSGLGNAPTESKEREETTEQLESPWLDGPTVELAAVDADTQSVVEQRRLHEPSTVRAVSL